MQQESQTQALIASECDAIKELLLTKNRKYGDSAINPTRVFSKASAEEQILVRLDDKLSRWKNQQVDEDEDVIMDLIGYLILYRIAKKTKENQNGKIGTEQAEDVAQGSPSSKRIAWPPAHWTENEVTRRFHDAEDGFGPDVWHLTKGWHSVWPGHPFERRGRARDVNSDLTDDKTTYKIKGGVQWNGVNASGWDILIKGSEDYESK
jgi:hypothetical protein